MKINKLLQLFFVFVLAFSLYVSAGPSQPIGIGGIITVDAVCLDGITISVTNVDTDETQTKTTENGGYYACALSANTGDTIKVLCDYNGTIYENTTIADTSLVTNWINLTITTETEDEEPDDEDDNGGWIPSPPNQSNSPVADFNVSPEQPIIWDIITFTDISTDPNDDIIARTWNIDGHVHTTIIVQCAFLKPGIYSASLLVMDSEGNTDTIEKAVTVYDATPDNDSDDSSGDENNTGDTPPDNITLTFEVNDQKGKPICNADVFVYDENNSMIAYVVTNESGVVTADVPPGSYKINVSYNGVSYSKDMSFSSNGRVGFTLMISDSMPPAGFNWWLVFIPVLIIIIIGVIIWKKEYLVRSQ